MTVFDMSPTDKHTAKREFNTAVWTGIGAGVMAAWGLLNMYAAARGYIAPVTREHIFWTYVAPWMSAAALGAASWAYGRNAKRSGYTPHLEI